MTLPRPLLMLALLAWVAVADQESCKDRCTEGFNANRKCQCDELCSYYQSCCADYKAECKPQVTRGDVFTLPEDDYGTYDYADRTKDNASVHMQSERVNLSTDLQAEFEMTTEEAPVRNPEEEVPGPGQEAPGPETTDQGILESLAEELCSGKPFDAFTDLKNGSLFAFRGRYCYELDEEAVKPGYPKLIRDVWGIEGPIDAAFTRINCQGKTYLFKGSQYWRFEDGVLDPGYPQDISKGFEGIPDSVDAALALPAHSYSGRERVYFFKGKQYWEYEFQQQPSREECEDSSLSAVFEQFALLQRSSWENIFEILFWGRSPGGAREPGFISRDWPGVPEQVDAAMVGRIYISAPPSSWLKNDKTKRRSRRSSRSRSRSGKRYGSRRDRSRGRSRGRSQNPNQKSRSPWLSWLSSEDSDLGDYNYDYDVQWLLSSECEPTQSIYFFSGDKYYRVNLRTRRVDTVSPPYPRNIAQYWLGCPAPGQ